jgi:prophage antirepressor-like protein
MKQDEKMEPNKIVVFESKKIRRIWHNEEWFFSVVDVCGALTDSPTDLTARKYWNKLSQRLREEGSEVVTNCHRLKLAAPLKLLRPDYLIREDTPITRIT